MATPATHSVDLRRVPAAVHPGHEGPTSFCRFKAYRRRLEAKAAADRAFAIAKAAEGRRAADVAKRRSDFIASLIG
jgi:hypothetical protein